MLEFRKFRNTIARLASVMLLVMLQLIPFSAFAEKIDAEQASSIASRFFSSKFKRGSGNGIKPLSVPGGGALKNSATEDAYYVFTPLSARGFVIVSGDDCLQPIVGYSTDNSFDPENLPDGLAAYLSDYAQVVKAMSEKGIEYKPATRGGQAVEPLMKVQWNQSEPYDRLTPTYGNDHAPTGCVATAIAQVMKYYNFPPSGHGTVNCNNETVDLGHTYDWDNMLDKYVFYYPDDYQYTDEQAIAVATLMRDVGYAVNMSYGRNASSASSARIPGAMCRYFNYSPDIRYVVRSSYSTQAWVDEIRANLLRGEPVLYGGTDGQYGHQFVCDGIDADDMLHINWGWGGSSDGYFDMNILSPDNLGIGAGNGAYYRDQDMVVNIRPGDASANYLETKLPLTASEILFTAYIDDEGKVQDEYNLGCNVTVFNTTGHDIMSRNEYAIVLCAYDDNENFVKAGQPNSVIGSFYQGYFYKGYVSLNYPDLEDGHYNLKVAMMEGDYYYSSNEVDVNDIIPIIAGDLNNINITIKSGSVYLDNRDMSQYDSSHDIRLIGAATDQDFYAGSERNMLSFTLHNFSTVIDETSYDIFLVPVNEVADGKAYISTSIGYASTYLYPGVSQEISAQVSLYNTKAGKYQLFLGESFWDDTDNVTKYRPQVASEQPIIIEVKALPDVFAITSPLQLDNRVYQRIKNPYIAFSFGYYNPGERFVGNLQLWARPVGGDSSQETLLFQLENYQFKKGFATVELDDWGEEDAVWFEELGDYEAYLKLVDTAGNPITVAGRNNLTTFVLEENDYEDRLQLASPIVINGGKPVEAKEYSEFDVEFEIIAPAGVNINPDGWFVIGISRTIKDSHLLYSFYRDSFEFEKTTLAPGEKSKVKVRFRYWNAPDEVDLVGSKLYVVMSYVMLEQEGYATTIQMNPYLDSACFELVAEGTGGVDEVASDGVSVDVKVNDNSVTVDNLAIGAEVELYNVAGVRIGRRVSINGEPVTIDAVTGGVYLLRVSTGKSAPIVRKLVVS